LKYFLETGNTELLLSEFKAFNQLIRAL